jgi:hypothetical protein
MTEVIPHRGAARHPLWAGLREDRFTNADVVLLVAASLLTAIVGILGVAAFLRLS